MGRLKYWVATVAGAVAGVLLVVAGVLLLPQAPVRADLEAFQKAAAFGLDIPDAAVGVAVALPADIGPVADGDLLGAGALARIVKADRAADDARRTLEAARTLLIAQAKTAPANPYLWSRLASVELALGAAPARCLTLLARSFAAGPNAVAAWPARVALGFRLWDHAGEPLRARILDEATRMWRKSGDRHWDRATMQARLVRLTVDAGLTDVVTPAIATSPAAFQRWNSLMAMELERS